MELNFNLSAAPAVSTSKPRLKPYEIHRVKLADVKVETLKGKKDPDAVYEILKVRFENTTVTMKKASSSQKKETTRDQLAKTKKDTKLKALATLKEQCPLLLN